MAGWVSSSAIDSTNQRGKLSLSSSLAGKSQPGIVQCGVWSHSFLEVVSVCFRLSPRGDLLSSSHWLLDTNYRTQMRISSADYWLAYHTPSSQAGNRRRGKTDAFSDAKQQRQKTVVTQSIAPHAKYMKESDWVITISARECFFYENNMYSWLKRITRRALSGWHAQPRITLIQLSGIIRVDDPEYNFDSFNHAILLLQAIDRQKLIEQRYRTCM